MSAARWVRALAVVALLAGAAPVARADIAPALAELMQAADALPAADVEARALALGRDPGPAGAEATLWFAEWLRRHERFDAALARYAEVSARWPGTEPARVALRGSAGAALAAERFELAAAFARQLPADAAGDRILREDLLTAAARGQYRATWMTRAWLALAVILAALLASLLEAARRGGWRRPVLAPATEVVFLGPVLAVLVGVALTTHELIAPAVLTVSLGGLALAYVSGAALDTLRSRGRAVRARAMLHALLCMGGVACLLYITLMRHQLMDMVTETMDFGPGG